MQLMPNVVHTYAPKGQTPELICSNRLTKVYMISAITPDGQLFYQTRDTRFLRQGLVYFLKYLVKRIRRNIILVWDGATSHYTQPIKDFLTTLVPGKLTLVRLPSNSPMLNPDEQVWAYLKKQSDLRNFTALNFTELRQAVRLQLRQLKKDPKRIRKMFHHPDCGFY